MAIQVFNRRYKVIRQLGQGGMGAVFLVEDLLRDNVLVALKTVRTDQADEYRLAQFKHEFAVLAQLHHPNLVKVYDFGYGEDTQESFFTMDYVPGEDWAAATRRRVLSGVFDITWLYNVITQVCYALQYIHARGFIHYDVKPLNVRITPEGQVKLMDFGLIGQSQAAGGRPARGTPEYVAPEVMQDAPVDYRADLYSLGVALYEIVTGRLPSGGRPGDWAETDPFLTGAEALPTSFKLPSELRQIIRTLLSPTPEGRYGSADAVIRALNAFTGENYPLGIESAQGGAHSGLLVGRHFEMAYLKEKLLDMLQGHGRLVLLTGPAGVGKSRLARELSVYAQMQRVLVCEGGCDEYVLTPYRPWVTLFKQLLMQCSSACMEKLQPYSDALGGLMPELTSLFGADLPLQSSPEEKARLLMSVVDGLMLFDKPLLLILEDLQYADAETLELLERVSQRVSQGKVLLLGLYRDAEIDAAHPLGLLARGAWPAHAQAQPSVAEGACLPELLRLELLDEAAVAELTCALLGAGAEGAARLPEGFLPWLMTETGGEPLFIESLLHSLIEDNRLRYDGEAWRVASEGLSRTSEHAQEMLQRRVARLEPAALRVLQWAAVLGQWLNPQVLAAVSGASADEIFSVMTQATRHYVLTLGARSGQSAYRFSNDQVRTLIYETLTPVDCARRHALCAEALRQHCPDNDIAEMLTWHYERAGHLEQAMHYAQIAGDRAAQVYAHRSAARYYSQALEFAQRCTQETPLQTLYALLHSRAAAFAYLEQYQAQLEDLVAMAQLAAALADLGRQIEVRNLQVAALAVLGKYDQALSLGVETLTLARKQADVLLLVDSLDVLGEAHFKVGKVEAAYAFHKEALQLCRPLGDRRRQAHLLWHLGNYARILGLPEARAYLQDSLELQRALGNQAGVADALNALGLTLEDYAQQRDYHEQSLAIANAIGDRSRQTRSHNNLGLTYWRLGLYPRAREYLERAIQLEREVFNRNRLVPLLESLGRVYCALEEYARAQQAYEEGLALGKAIGDDYGVSLHYFGMGQIKLASGDPEAARFLFAQALGIQQERKLLAILCASQAWLGAAELALGHWELAERHTREAVQTLRVSGVGEFLAQEAWWWRYQVLSRAAPERRASLAAEAWRALQRAHEAMLAGIATLNDEGLRRNYLNKVRINRDILTEWTRCLAAQQTSPEAFDLPAASPAASGPLSESEQFRNRFKRVLDISVRMNETHDVESLLHYVMDQVIELIGAERGVLALFDRQHQMHFRVAVGMALSEVVDGKAQISYTVLETLAQSRQPLLLQDALTDERFGGRNSVLELNLRSVLCVPLIARAELTGLIYVDNRSASGRFSPTDLDLLTIFANQAATAIENARLYGDLMQANVQLENWAHTLEERVTKRTAEVKTINAVLSRRAIQLETSRQVAQQIISILELDALLERVVSLIQSQFGYSFVGVWLVNTARGELVLRAGADLRGRRFQNTGMAIPLEAPSFSTSVYRTGKARVAQNGGESPDFWNAPARPPLAAELGLPLLIGAQVVGVLNVGGDQAGQFVEEEIGVLQGLADQLAIAIRNAQLYQAEQRRRKLTELLEQTGRELTSSLDMHEAPGRILALLNILTPYVRGMVMLREGDTLRSVAHYGILDIQGDKDLVVPITEGDVFRQLESLGHPLIVHDTIQESGWKQVPWLPRHRSWMGVLLIAKGRAIGMISLTRREPYAFSEEDATWVQAFATQASIALENARYHTELVRFSAQLEQMVQQRTQELDETNRILAQLNKTKSTFITVAAHELFTPLTAISSFAQLLQRYSGTQPPPHMKEYLEGIVVGAKRMQDIIDRMRDTARINLQTWEVSHDSVVLAELLRQITQAFACPLLERRLTLTLTGLDTLPVISGDAEMLSKALYHVIINAIKYTPDGGRITVSGFETTMENNRPSVELIVADTGVGIDPQNLELVFESFYQTGSVEHHFSGDTEYKAGGPGLGLTIARGVIEAHGGKIWAESETYDETRYPGSRFHIQLPVYKPDTKPEIGNEK